MYTWGDGDDDEKCNLKFTLMVMIHCHDEDYDYDDDDKYDCFTKLSIFSTIMMMVMDMMVTMVPQHIPTMTKSHHGGEMSVMIKVGICQ